MTAANRYQRSTNILQAAFKVGLMAGIGMSTILGVPPFISAVSDLLGGTVGQIETIVSDTPLLADVIKYSSMSFWALGGYGIFKSNLPTFKKMIGIGLCTVVLVNFYALASPRLASYLVGALIPIIGSTIWAVVNAAQIFMLTLRNNPDALKKLLGKLGQKSDPEIKPEESATQQELRALLGRNKVSTALSFFMFCGTAGYVVEFLINVAYSSNSINWMSALAPGGIVSLGWSLVTSILVLLFTIGSIEFFVMSLQNLDEMKDAIE